MADLITLTCPTCSAKLKVTDKVHILVCASCGNEHMVNRDGGAIYLAPLAEDVRQIRVSSDKTAAELAIARLSKEIGQLEDKLKATGELPDSHYISKNSISSFTGGLSIGALALSGIISISGMIGIALTIFFISMVGFAYLFTLTSKEAQEAKDRRNAELERIKTAIESKTIELTKNQRIVSE